MITLTTPKSSPIARLQPKVLNMPWSEHSRLIVNQLTGLYHWGDVCLGRELCVRVLDIKPIAIRMWDTGCYVFEPEDGDVFSHIVDSFESRADTDGLWGILYKVFHRRAGTTTLFTSPYTMYSDGPCHINDQVKLTTERIKGADWYRPVIIHK